MAKEYKLSYTATDINAKLGKIDSLASKNELESKSDINHTHTVESIEGLQEAVGSAADSKFYVVTFDKGADGEYHADLTFAEIREKFEAGGNMVARIDGTDYIPLLSAATHQIIFSGIYQATSVALTVGSNNVCTLTSTSLANSSHTHPTASTAINGFMSKEDKVKLNGIETGAEVNVIESITVNGEEVTVTDKAVNIEIPEQIQSDWNQNDEAAVDYIKNKPFYDNTEVLLDTITVNNGDELELNIKKDIGIQGDIITVVWDGVSTEQTIGYCDVEFGNLFVSQYTIGNQSYLNSGNNIFEDTGETYLINNDEGSTTSVVYCDDASHTLSIIKGALLQIDEKFIPDAIAKKTYVDEKIDAATSAQSQRIDAIEAEMIEGLEAVSSEEISALFL